MRREEGRKGEKGEDVKREGLCWGFFTALVGGVRSGYDPDTLFTFVKG